MNPNEQPATPLTPEEEEKQKILRRILEMEKDWEPSEEAKRKPGFTTWLAFQEQARWAGRQKAARLRRDHGLEDYKPDSPA